MSAVGMKGADKDIGPWAPPDDIKELKGKHVLVKTSKLLGRGRGLIIMNR